MSWRQQANRLQTIIGRIDRALVLVLMLSLQPPVLAGPPPDSAFLDGGDSKSALILCHGRGKHPRWRVVDPLRKAVQEELGWHTLSLQMPAEDKHAWAYAGDFPEAFASIKRGIAWLTQEKGVETVYLMGHSMGARMASAFMAANPDAAIARLIVAGLRNNGGLSFDGKESLKAVDIPVLDVWGDGGNGKDSQYGRERVELRSDKYQQIPIAGANHKFVDHEQAFTDAVIAWLKAQG